MAGRNLSAVSVCIEPPELTKLSHQQRWEALEDMGTRLLKAVREILRAHASSYLSEESLGPSGPGF